MTKYLKLGSTPIIVKCILGVIILSLIFSTMNVYINQDSEKYIATVNGEKISFITLQNMYLIEKEKQKKTLGKNFYKLIKDKKFIRKTYNYLLSQLINNILLEQYAKKMQLQVNELQIKEIILNSPLFHKNQKFNKEKYFNYLTSANLTNREYIDIIKTKINTENLINSIANTNFILKDEQNTIFKLLSERRIIKTATLKIDSLIQEQNVNDIESKKYFDRYKNNFYIPKKFKINFVQFKLDDFKSNCSKKEIYTWYVKNIKKYSTQEKRRYSIIQTKNQQDAILILSELNKNPKNFIKIAKEKSTDPISSKNGGDLGWISIDSIPDEIKNAHLNQKNFISNIIPFENQFLIVKLNKISTSKNKPLNEVYDTIKNEIIHKKSLYLYNKIKNEIYDIIKNNPNKFNLILKKFHFSVQKTDWFDKNSVPPILNFSILKNIIFSKKIFDNNNKIKFSLHFINLKNNMSFLINITDFENKKMQEYKEVKKEIIEKIKIIKAIKETEKKSEKIVFELNKGNQNLLKKSNVYFEKTEDISRYDERPITSIVFSLPRPRIGVKRYALYKDKNNNFIIIFLQKIYNNNFSKKEKNIIIEYLKRNNTETIFNSLLQNLHKQSIIKYEKIKEI